MDADGESEGNEGLAVTLELHGAWSSSSLKTFLRFWGDVLPFTSIRMGNYEGLVEFDPQDLHRIAESCEQLNELELHGPDVPADAAPINFGHGLASFAAYPTALVKLTLFNMCVSTADLYLLFKSQRTTLKFIQLSFSLVTEYAARATRTILPDATLTNLARVVCRAPMSEVFDDAPDSLMYTQAAFIPHLGELLSPLGDDDGTNRGCIEVLYLSNLACDEYDVATVHDVVAGTEVRRSMPRAISEMVSSLVDTQPFEGEPYPPPAPHRTFRKFCFGFGLEDDEILEEIAAELVDRLREEHGEYLRICPGEWMEQTTPLHRNGGFGPAQSDSSGSDDGGETDTELETVEESTTTTANAGVAAVPMPGANKVAAVFYY